MAKVREDAPFDKICYIGCGVTTGIGAVIYTAKVWAGANVVVFGLGGIGLNVIQGARMVGADKIIGIDLNPAKAAMAKKFGMTDFVNPDEVGRDKVVQAIVDLTGGGADFSFEASATPNHAPGARMLPPRLGRVASSSASPHPARKSPPGRSSWSPDASGEAPPSAARGAHRRAEDRRLVHGKKINIDDLITHTHAARRDQHRVRPDARRQVDPQRRGVLRTAMP